MNTCWGAAAYSSQMGCPAGETMLPDDFPAHMKRYSLTQVTSAFAHHERQSNQWDHRSVTQHGLYAVGVDAVWTLSLYDRHLPVFSHFWPFCCPQWRISVLISYQYELLVTTVYVPCCHEVRACAIVVLAFVVLISLQSELCCQHWLACMNWLQTLWLKTTPEIVADSSAWRSESDHQSVQVACTLITEMYPVFSVNYRH